MTFPWLVVGTLGTASIAWLVGRTTRQYAAAALAGGGVILYLHGWLYFHYTSDDAYISYRYARNLADGLGLVWNKGDWVEGYTDFLWVVILASADVLGANVVLTARWLGFGCAVVALAETYLLTRMLLEGAAGRAAGFAAVMVLCAAGPFAIWSFAGLETPLFAALTLCAVLLHMREDDGFRPPLSGIAWALVAMTHPDGLLLFAISGLFKLGCAALRATARTRSGWRASVGQVFWLAVWALGFAALYTPYFAWRYQAYGWLFPNTFYAKVGSGVAQYQQGLTYLGDFARDYAGWLVLVPVITVVLVPRHAMRRAYVTALLLGWFAYVAYIGGDSLLRFRFFAPLLPLFYADVIAATGLMVAAVAGEYRQRRLATEAVLAVAVLGLMAFMLQASIVDVPLRGEREAVAERVEIGRWLRINVPDTTVIAVFPAGAIPYESRLSTVDILGINDEHIAHLKLSVANSAAGHNKYDTAYVLNLHPDVIIIADTYTAAPMTRADYTPLIGGLIPGRTDLLTSDRLWSQYEPRAVQVRAGKWLNLLVARSSAAVLALTRTPSIQAK